MTSYSSLETYPERSTVLEIRDTSWQPPWGGNIGFQWRGPNWPPWKIDPIESEVWLAEWTERARELVGAWLERREAP